MNRMLVGNSLATFGAATITPDRRVSAAAANHATNGFFRGIVFGFVAVVPFWTGLIWLGLRLFNHG
ncbi:MAG: hypothetical protein ACRYGI_15570 [Janthinobacterium lividum]